MTFSSLRSVGPVSLRAFLIDQRGATAVEYSLVVAGIALATMTVIFAVGTGIKETLYARISAVLAQM